MSTEKGQKAENVAAAFLKEGGFKIVERNWKRPVAEIDIVAEKNGIAYFVEVKYRSSPHQGLGVEYITQSKLRQMQRAASFWMLENVWQGPSSLSAINVGKDYRVTNFIDSLIV